MPRARQAGKGRIRIALPKAWIEDSAHTGMCVLELDRLEALELSRSLESAVDLNPESPFAAAGKPIPLDVDKRQPLD